MVRKTWTEEDLQYIRDNVHLSHTELGKLFGVSAGAISRVKTHYRINRLTIISDHQDRQWRVIDEFPLYEVSNHGEVRNTARGNLLKSRINKDGYPQITFKLGTRTLNRTVHRLVALAWLPRLDGENEVNHRDGVKTHCSVTNLEWTTERGNIQHAHANGLMNTPKGAEHWTRRDPERFKKLVRDKRCK